MSGGMFDGLRNAEEKMARKEEMEFATDMPVYEERDVAERWRVKGKPPVPTKWIDRHKDADKVRSRWVALDFQPKGDGGREDLFAATPPLEAKKALFKLAAKMMRGWATKMKKKKKKMKTI